MTSANEDDIFDSIVNRQPRGSPTDFDKMIKTTTYSSRASKKASFRPIIEPKLTIHVYINEEASSIQERRNKINEVESHVIMDGSVFVSIIWCHTYDLNLYISFCLSNTQTYLLTP
jgi:hypothetical protein